MPDKTAWLGFAFVGATMVCIPGPNMLNLLAQVAAYGRRAGYVTLAGAICGLALIAFATVAGVASLLIRVPALALALKIGGALYLVWLALRALRGGLDVTGLRGRAAPSASGLFARGLLTNALNPKAALLFVALLPPFVNPERGSVVEQMAVLAATQLALSATINALIVGGAGSLIAFLDRRPAVARAARLAIATALGVFALRLALT